MLPGPQQTCKDKYQIQFLNIILQHSELNVNLK